MNDMMITNRTVWGAPIMQKSVTLWRWKEQRWQKHHHHQHLIIMIAIIMTFITIIIIAILIITILIRIKIDWVAGKVSELLAARIIRPHFVTTSVFVLPSNTKTSNTKTLSQHQFGLLSLCHNISSPPDKDLLFTTLLYSRSASKICFLQLFKVTFSIFTQPNTDTAVNLNP